MTSGIAFIALLAVLGLAFGSFANVVIWRLPRGESLSVPASHCPSCDTPIAWRDNIPVVSWLVLRGKCRSCSAPIAVRYPLVEIASGLLWVGAGLVYGPTLRGAAAIAFFYLLLVLAAIDLDTMRLPNSLVALLAAIGAVAALVAHVTDVPIVPLTGSVPGWSPFVVGAASALAAVAVTGGMAFLYHAVRGVQGFGMGDIKLLGAMGFFLGPFVFMALFVGALLGAVAGIATARRSGSVMTKFPFGPYLAMGGIVTGLFGTALWNWYSGFLGL